LRCFLYLPVLLSSPPRRSSDLFARRRSTLKAPDRYLIRLGQQGFEVFESCFGWIQHGDPVIRTVDRMRHQHIERSEVVLSLAGEQRSIRLFRDADVQPEDVRPVEVGLVVELAVVLDDDGREWKSSRALEVA